MMSRTSGSRPASAVGEPSVGVIPASPLTARANALRAGASFIERADIPRLSLTVDGDRITVQVP
jgi:hypothetical protein